MFVIIVLSDPNMCEKRSRKLKRGSQITRLREARRLQRIRAMPPSPATTENIPAQLPQMSQLPQMIPVDKAVQNKVILELAWKTVALMHKNRLIQQKIVALQKETSEFVANIMNNPENRRRYMDRVRSQANAAARARDMTIENKENNNIIFKMEPEA